MQLLRAIFVPLASLALMMLGCGLLSTYIPVRLEIAGYHPEVVGYLTSAFYVGALGGSFKSDRWIAKLGHARSLLLLSASMVVLILLQSLWFQLWYWAAIRALTGYCVGALYVAIESWILLACNRESRGQGLSLYLGVLYGSLSLGQFFLEWLNPRSNTPFLFAAVLGTLSLLPLLGAKKSVQMKVEPISLSLREIFFVSPIGFLGGIVSGMLLASVYGFVPYFAVKIGLTTGETSQLMAALIFGGLSLQWPMGYMADRRSRKQALALAAFLSAIAALAMIPAAYHSYWLFMILAWVFGGFSFTLYPLSMGFTCEKVAEEHVIAVTGGFVLSWGLGAIFGPLIAGYFMDFTGVNALFVFLTIITCGLGFLSLNSKR